MTVWNCSCSREAYKMCERSKLKQMKKTEDALSILLVQSVPSLKARWTLYYGGNDQCPFAINFVQLSTISPFILFMHVHDLSPAILPCKETNSAGNLDRGGLLKRCALQRTVSAGISMSLFLHCAPNSARCILRPLQELLPDFTIHQIFRRAFCTCCMENNSKLCHSLELVSCWWFSFSLRASLSWK